MDPELLAQLPEELRDEVAAAFAKLTATCGELKLRITLLSEHIRLLMIEKYGSGAEKLSDMQLSLLELEPGVCKPEVEAEAALPPAAKVSREPRKRPVRSPIPAGLPREERLVPCTQAQCLCGQCGGAKKLIGYEESERISIKPLEFFVEVTKREKRACGKCEEMGVSVAAVPAAIIEKGILSDALVVEVIIKKYSEHNPLYRQSMSMERDTGLGISQATLSSSVLRAGVLCAEICAHLKADLLAGPYIQADETTVPVQSRLVKGKNHQAYLWEYCRPGGPVYYDFQMGRSREGLKTFLGNFNGRLQSDGYCAYDKIGGCGIKHFGCWAHVRRKFYDASKADPKDAKSVRIVAAIGKLYDVERDARERNLDPQARAALRQEKSVPLLAAIKTLIRETAQTPGVLPQSALGKACSYALNQWERLEPYTAKDHGCVEIDNNIAENGMRGVAIGRRNWLHIGSEGAGPKVAAIISLLETCKRLDINARKYLLSVLPRVAQCKAAGTIATLTPAAWQLTSRQVAA